MSCPSCQIAREQQELRVFQIWCKKGNPKNQEFIIKKIITCLSGEYRLVRYHRTNGEEADHKDQYKPTFGRPDIQPEILDSFNQLHKTTSRGIPRYFDRTFISIIAKPSFGRGDGDRKGSENDIPNGLWIFIMAVMSGISFVGYRSRLPLK